MNRINVNTKNRDYEIVITDSFGPLSDEVKALDRKYSKVAIFADNIVGPLYIEEVKKSLEKVYNQVYTFVFETGEGNKTLETISQFYSFLIENEFDRKSLLVALGGGVTGDMVGYLAATYLRGVRFVQVPTTILSQVDSSVGGKTGVDFKGYKNAVGAFYQPELVFINTNVLKTLSKEQLASGMGEVIKHGVIRDKEYFEFLEENVDKIKSLDHETISHMIEVSCKIKSVVVSEDEKELGIRATLNFGHTIGHAIERLKGFTLLHGECVSIGMVAAVYISKSVGNLTEGEVNKIIQLIKSYDLLTETDGLEPETIYEELFHDKKTYHNKINFILTNEIGSCYMKDDVEKEIVMTAIEKVVN